MVWTLLDESTELNLGGSSVVINPGTSYPAGYTGSKYSIRRVGKRYHFSVKSYSGNFVEATNLPKGIMKAITKYKPGFSGTMRIRWNGDTILAPINLEPPLFIGKMSYGDGAETLFPGLNLKQETEKMCLYAGPQSALDIGEPWSVPSRQGHIRPRLTRRFRVEGMRERINTETEHLELTNFAINDLDSWDGKRLYFTNFGQVVTPVTLSHLRLNSLDLGQEIKTLASQKLDTAVRFSMDRIERTHKSYGRPWVMFVVGNVDCFGGPQPDLSSGPEYDLSDENAKRGKGD